MLMVEPRKISGSRGFGRVWLGGWGGGLGSCGRYCMLASRVDVADLGVFGPLGVPVRYRTCLPRRLSRRAGGSESEDGLQRPETQLMTWNSRALDFALAVKKTVGIYVT